MENKERDALIESIYKQVNSICDADRFRNSFTMYIDWFKHK